MTRQTRIKPRARVGGQASPVPGCQYTDPNDDSYCGPLGSCPPGSEGFTDATGTYCEPTDGNNTMSNDGWNCKPCRADPHCGNRTIRVAIANGTTDTSFNGLVPSIATQALKVYMIAYAAADGDLHDVRIEYFNPNNPTTDRVLVYDDGGLVQTVAVVDTNDGDGWIVVPQDSGQPYQLRVVAAGLAGTGATLLVHYGYISMEGL